MLGRLLAAIGLVWVFWGFFGAVIGLQFGNDLLRLSPLPGIVIFFLGRALARRAQRGELSPKRESPSEAQVPARLEPQTTPSPVRERSPQEPPAAPQSPGVAEVIMETFEPPEPQESLLEAPGSRKTSAEMVREARERFGRRP